MGTNYYLVTESKCEHCGHTETTDLHFGKTAAGWVFMLRIHPDLGIHNLNDWANRYARGPRSRIEDECDGVYTFEEIVEKAKEFSQNGRSMSSEDSRARHVPDLGGMDLLGYEFS